MGRELPGWLTGKECACQCRRHRRQRFSPWVRKIPWRRKWQPTPVFLPGKSHGRRSLVGHGPQGHKESGTTEPLSVRAHTHTSGKRTAWHPYSAVETCGLGWGRCELEVGGRQKTQTSPIRLQEIKKLFWKVLVFPSAGPAPKHISESAEFHGLL